MLAYCSLINQFIRNLFLSGKVTSDCGLIAKRWCKWATRTRWALGRMQALGVREAKIVERGKSDA